MLAMLRTKRPRARTVFSLLVVASLIGTGLWAAPSAGATTQAAPAQPTGGVVAAWGGNGSSQLGATTGACPGKNLCSTTALLVSNLDGVSIQSVSAGGLHSLALATDGTVWAWGSNYFNQVGIGSNSPSACTPPNGNCQVATPSQVGGLSNIQAVAAGGTHSLALTTDGHVWAWGANYLGQLGNGSFKGSATPVEVGGTANPLSGVTAIAAGGTHSLALKNDGTVWAWGGDIFGQLGLGKGKLSSDVPVQVSSLMGVTVTKIAAGGLHSLALDSTGAMWAWGANFAGQLGDGGYKNHNAPEQVGPSGVTAIAAGGLHSLAISMFGDASQNQAGTSQPASAKNKRNRKHLITPQPRVGSGSTLYAWGYNRDGELGLGYTTNTGCRCVTDPQVVEGAFGAADIAAGGVQSLALMSDGTVLSWGSNGTGELGNDSTTSSASPVQVDGLSGIDTSASAHNQIAAGGLHNLALGPAPNVTTPTPTDTAGPPATQTPDAAQTAMAQETATAQQGAVDAAQTAAAEAQGTANAADTAAANAQGTAVSAQQTAAAAGADDSNAQTAAAVAQTAASIAQTAAANAQTAAAAQQAAAQQTADAAAANATSAAGTVAAAATAVAQAQQTVSAAQTALAQVIQIQQTAIAAIETALAGGGGAHSSVQSHVALPSAQQLVAAQQTVTAAQAVLAAAQQSSGIRPADLVSAQQTATAVVGAISSAQTALAAAQAVLAAAQQTYTAAQATGTAAAAQFAAPAQTAAAIAQQTGTAAAQTVSAVQTGAAGQNGQNAATQTAAAQIISANQTAAAAARQTAGVVQATAEAQLAAAAATANAAATAFAAAQTQAAGIGVVPANTPVTPPQNTPVTPPQNTAVTPPQNTPVTLPAVSLPASTQPTVVPIVLPQPTASVSRPKPKPAKKPTIRITLPKQGAFSGRTLTVTVLTSPKVRVSVSLQAFGSKTVVVGKGKKKHKVVQRIVIYKQTRTGITGLHGAFVAHLPVTIKVKTKPIQAVITASARIGKTALIGTARVLIHPALKAVHAAPVKPAGKHAAKTKKK